MSSEQVKWYTAQDAATRAAEWLLSIEARYMEDRAQGDEQNFQIESALAQGWATLAVALS